MTDNTLLPTDNPIPHESDMAVLGNDDSVLKYTQKVRKRIVEQVTGDGRLPEDKGIANLLVTVLADMDRTALGNKRISKDSESNAEDRKAAMIIAELTRQFSSHGTPAISNREVPTLERSRIPNKELLPGQGGIGIDETNYGEFIGKMEGTEE